MSTRTYTPNITGDEPNGLTSEEFNPALPFVAPNGCLGYRLRVRPGEFASVVLRFADRTEVRSVVRKDGQQMPGLSLGANFRKGTP